MKNAEVAASILQAMREKGVRIAIDDFGAGYSSLSYLRKFPIDALKIDQSFVRQIRTSPDDTAIVTAIINLGQSLKLRSLPRASKHRKISRFCRSAGVTRRRDITSAAPFRPHSLPCCSMPGKAMQLLRPTGFGRAGA